MPDPLPLEEVQLPLPLSPEEESLIRLGGRFHCIKKLSPGCADEVPCWALVQIMYFGPRDVPPAYLYCPGCRRVTGFAYTTELTERQYRQGRP